MEKFGMNDEKEKIVIKLKENGCRITKQRKMEVPVLDAAAIGVSVLCGDTVVIHIGNVIPFDGEVTAGEGMVSQASLTGQSCDYD